MTRLLASGGDASLVGPLFHVGLLVGRSTPLLIQNPNPRAKETNTYKIMENGCTTVWVVVRRLLSARISTKFCYILFPLGNKTTVMTRPL